MKPSLVGLATLLPLAFGLGSCTIRDGPRGLCASTIPVLKVVGDFEDLKGQTLCVEGYLHRVTSGDGFRFFRVLFPIDPLSTSDDGMS